MFWAAPALHILSGWLSRLTFPDQASISQALLSVPELVCVSISLTEQFQLKHLEQAWNLDLGDSWKVLSAPNGVIQVCHKVGDETDAGRVCGVGELLWAGAGTSQEEIE